MIFSIFRFFLHPQIPDFLIVVSQPNIVQTIHQWKYNLFSFQMMYKSQFWKIVTYDWFCGPGSQIIHKSTLDGAGGEKLMLFKTEIRHEIQCTVDVVVN